MQGNTVHRSRHAMFTHPVMNIAAGRIVVIENRLFVNAGVVRTGQVSRTAKQRRTGRDNGSNCLLAGNTGCNLLWFSRQPAFPGQDRLIDGGTVIACDGCIECGAVSGGMAVLPGSACRSAPAANGTPCCHDVIRNFEWRMRPAKRGARASNFVSPEGGTMHTGGAGLFGCAKTDHGAAADQGRFAGFLFCCGDGVRDGIHVMPVNRQNLPAISLKAARGIFRDSKVGAAINRNAIVIEQHDQAIKPHMSGH